MKGRRLTREERALWQKVTDKTDPLHDIRRSADAVDPPLPVADPVPTPNLSLPLFRVGQDAPLRSSASTVVSPVDAPRVTMDRKAFQKMKRGKLVPEARLDLHGMTLARAHPVLSQFILSSRASGKRLVLVITGKGRDRPDDGPIPSPRGVLKRQVPQWLSMPPLRDAVLQVSEAHVSHGGGGALYIYLRKPR